ncbi:SapC family protein [Niveispirillum sp. KHB5.9]|uniref:SapC family protein n=1 Tax=Niveispirillum sp. KHB5.9 TaxID=3400269 RepID=UPI003A83A2C9
MTDVANAADAQQMPLLYNNPVAVSAQRHGDVKVKRNRTFKYASKIHAVPVLAEEMPQLQNHYPLVFGPGPSAGVMALTGLRAGENLFVREDGSWALNSQIPAYIGRYPFILVEMPEDKRLVLIMEEDEEILVKGAGAEGDMALFADGKGTKEGEEILNYCVAFNQSARQTQAFCEEVEKLDLLVEQRAEVVTPDGKQLSLSGFRIIDETKFNALPDETFLEWRKRNWIGLVYAHFVSLGRWQNLIDRLPKAA